MGMTFCSLPYRRRENCTPLGEKLSSGVALCSASVLGYSEGWASLMQCTALGTSPPDETQVLSSSCEVIFLLVHQMQQHTEPVRRKIPPEVCSYMYIIIFKEMKILGQHCTALMPLGLIFDHEITCQHARCQQLLFDQCYL